jgi:hypothetical protein
MKLSKRSYLLLAGVLAAALTMYAGARWVEARNSVTLPAGTTLQVSLDHSLASNQNSAGDEFTATLTRDVVVDERTVVPAGARARGVVVSAQESGRLKGVAHLSVALTALEVNGDWYDIATNTLGRRGPNHKKNNWSWIGGGAAGGTIIGAIAGSGKGALIGGPIGAGAGVAGAAITGKRDIRLSADRVLAFRLAEPATLPVSN